MSEEDHFSKIDHDQLVETTARLTCLMNGSPVVRLKVSVGPYKWDIESLSSAGEESGLRVSPATMTVVAPEPVGHNVVAPVVGVFYRAPAPAAASFAEVGQQVAAGDQLAIVEAMKMMNPLLAPCAGVISAIHADDGAIVEYGERLFTIEPA